MLAARDWFFAWLANETEVFDPVAHKVIDVPQAAIDIVEEEGKDAVLVSIKRDALPSDSYLGMEWAILSFETADGVVHPVARMKMAKRPLGQTDAVAELTFTTLPSDFLPRRTAGLAPLKVLPAYDPVAIEDSKLDDPVEILDGHQRVAHFDRVSQAFSTPNILGVGLPKKTFTMSDLIGWADGGGITVRQTRTPLRGVRLILSAEWLQRFDGYLDATAAIKGLFASELVETLTGDEFERSWFKAGASVNGASGYTVIKSKIREVSVPAGSPKRMGPVRGQKARYNYVDDPDFLNPRGMGLPVRYYDPELGVSYVVSQKRAETVEILILNDGPGAEEGEIRDLEIKLQDVALDRITPQFIGLAQYFVGDVVKNGANSWRCLANHLSKANFSADQYRIEGGILVPQWEPLANDNSPIGGPNRDTYFLTARGELTVQSGVLRAMRLIAESQRCVEVEFHVPFEDVVGMSTAWQAELIVDDDLIPGGWCQGKVVRFHVSDPDRASFAKASITIECCTGGGEAPAAGTGPVVNYSGQPWDAVALDSWAGQNPVPYPEPGGSARLINGPADQLIYVQANDYQRGVPGRDDRTANDPKTLLRQVPTEIVLDLVDLAPRPDMTNAIVVNASGWSGPRQIDLPE